MITITTVASTLTFDTVEEYTQHEVTECRKELIPYWMYVDYMNQFDGEQRGTVVTEGTYNRGALQ